jgi:hypothetical protein
VTISGVVALTALVLLPGIVAARDVDAGGQTETEAGGVHTRIETSHGPVHLFRPAGYDRRSAGLVIYVHGLYTHIDQAWGEHHLAEQFAASGANALFIAPEAPAAADEEPPWDDLESLIGTALRRARLRRPGGSLIAAGHSGAYRTLVPWLQDPALRHLILIDGLYGNEDEFRAWLEADAAHKMTLVMKGTARRAEPFARSFRRAAVTLPRIPDSFENFTRAERTAKLLCLRSQYGHMELITEGRTLPILLRRTALGRLPSRPAAADVPSASPSPSPSASPSPSPSPTTPPSPTLRQPPLLLPADGGAAVTGG